MPEPLDLEPIKARLTAATAGPWRQLDPYADDQVRGGSDDELWVVVNGSPDYAADARLIAHAPSDIAALIAEVERLRNERGFWRESTVFLSGRRAQD